jgi:hypothetical protein
VLALPANASTCSSDIRRGDVVEGTGSAGAGRIEDRVYYKLCEVTQSIPGTYDLITSFDVMHDLPHPRLALAAEVEFGHIRRLDFPANPFNLFYKLRV